LIRIAAKRQKIDICFFAPFMAIPLRAYMKKATLLILLILCFSTSLFAQEKRDIGNLVIDGIPEIPQRIVDRTAQYQNVRSASLSDWHPSGNGMLITTRFGESTQLFHVSAPGSYRRQITFFNEPVSSGRYSPRKDRNGFVFTMDVGGGEFFQFYWFDEAQGKHSMLTDGKSRNESFLWSNSGDKAAFVSTKRNGVDFDIYVMDGLNPQAVHLVKELSGQWNPIDWSPDDSQLLVQNFISANEAYLFVLNPTTAELTEINPTNKSKKIAYDSARFSHDGKGVYYISDEESEFQRLTYYDLATKKKTVITPELNWDVSELDVSTDGRWIAYTVNEGGISKLYLSPAASPARAHAIDLEKGVIGSLRFDRQNTRLGFSLSSSRSPSDVYSLDLKTRKVTRWTFSEVGGLNAENFVTPELIEYPTFDTVGGKPRMIPAFYYRPRGETKKPFPVIINIHGGPEGQSFASFSSTSQYYVNELGAAVLVPNVRGSTGYGKTYLQLDNGIKREDSVKDIGKLIDWIATRPELDATRVAVTGGSYGGYMVLASMIHFNDRLKCGVDSVGISNFVTFLESTKGYRRNLRRVEYGDESEPKMREFLISISPNINASKITKPLFVMQGQNDPRVPMSEAEQMVKTVRGNGGVVWYLLGKDEGHGFKKKANQEYFLNAVSLFFEKHLLQ
jgi:dipeptidyl aminopeptidase/acylaminoacyl peptidase